MMMDYYYSGTFSRITHDWWRNGCQTTMKQIDDLPDAEQQAILAYLDRCPYYETVTVEGKPYFLSHSGLNAALPLDRQTPDDFVWSRDDFYAKPALTTHFCLFGHTPTLALHGLAYSCAVWLDTEHNDKMCIDCGCVYGGALAALRLDDGEVFYVKSADPGRDFADSHW
jgi:serine/threonine protein phosphatase 1